MGLTIQEVEHIAELAKLRLTAEEKTRYREQLSAILDYANCLQAVDTTGIPQTATVLPLKNVMREDKQQPSLPPDVALANAQEKENGFFRVPPILDE